MFKSNFLYWSVLIPTLIIFAIWNIPHTVSIKYFLLILLIISLMFARVDIKEFSKWAWPIWLFLFYLAFHGLFLSSNWLNFLDFYWSDWLKYVVLTFIGAGIGTILAQKNIRHLLLWLSIALAIPIFIHIALFTIRAFELNQFPLRYWGINDIHGDFAYPAIHISIFLIIYFSYQANKLTKFISVAILVLALMSNIFANSRGGVLFMAISIAITTVLVFIFNKSIFRKKRRLVSLSLIFSPVVIMVVVYLIMNTINYDRWNLALNIEKIKIGFIGDPVEINCYGVDLVRTELINNKVEITNNIDRAINEIKAGDAARIVTARAGIQLIKDNPWGIDGSREAYQIAISKKCKPTIGMAHTHNAWIDTALAIGIVGMLLFFFIFVHYGNFGLKTIKKNNQLEPYGLCLLAISIVWILRGLLDSTHRVQMLEMQAIPFSMIVAIIIAKIKNA